MAFGVLWMTVGLGPAILCLLLAGLGYGAVLAAERAHANPEAFRLPVREGHIDLAALQGDRISGVVHANHEAFC